MKPLILASSSPRRREILTLTGLSFEVLTPSVEEEEIPLTDPDVYVEELSLIKCRAGLREAGAAHTQALVIGADTIVYHNGRILGKPRDEEDAFDMPETESPEEALPPEETDSEEAPAEEASGDATAAE